MKHSPTDQPDTSVWQRVKQNPTYFPDTLSEAAERRIRWHSPDAPHSSQIFSVSVFGTLRRLPDSNALLSSFLMAAVPNLSIPSVKWRIYLEAICPRVLGEVGGNASNIDVLCVSPAMIVAIETKFLSDALKGFGDCSQPDTEPFFP